MKRKTMLTLISLILALTILIPAQITAAPEFKLDKPGQAEKFEAAAFVYISDAGESTTYKQVGPLLYELTTGEEISGQIINSLDWPEFNGAVFSMTCDTNDAVVNFAANTLRGSATGTITMVNYDENDEIIGILVGSYSASIRGKFFTDEQGYPVFYEVTDSAKWELFGVDGIYEGTTAAGTASVTLTPGEGEFSGTLVGIMNLSGRYR